MGKFVTAYQLDLHLYIKRAWNYFRGVPSQLPETDDTKKLFARS